MKLQENTVTTISGHNGSGKTTLIKYIIKANNFEKVVVISNTAEMTGDFKGHIVLSPINYEESLNKLMKIQEKSKKKILLIFDDIAGMVKDSKTCKILISQQRHFNITIIFSVQFVSMSASYLREISSYDIIFSLKTQQSYKAAYENYFLTDYPSLRDFIKNFKLGKFCFYFLDHINDTKKIYKCPS